MGTLPDGKRKNTKLILRLKMRRILNNTNLTCEAQNLAQSPEVMREGDTVKYSCLVSASPGNVSYQWSVGGDEQLLGGDHSILVLPGVTRNSHTHVVKCRVWNNVGFLPIRIRDVYHLYI